MRLRVVIPVLNEGDGLARRLTALHPLRARGSEIVVVDGGSTDNTWAVARALADRVLLAPRGRAAQMNAGARGSQADALLFLHADTELPVDADLLIAQALEASLWGRFDVRIDSELPMLRIVERLMNLRSRLSGMATGDQAMFMRRAVFDAEGGFAGLPLMEDIELSTRLKRRSPPACLRAQVTTSGRRWEKQGTWRTIVLMWQLRARYAWGADPQMLATVYGYLPGPVFVTAGVCILAKAPVAGLAKTRLAPTLGEAAAARAQRRFTCDTVDMVHAAAMGPSVLWCAPAATHRFFRALRRVRGTVCRSQPAGDLGARMRHACDRHFADHPRMPLLLIGTDCPVLAPGHLQQAAFALTQHDVVLIPAEDGGYVLIGVRKPVPQVFETIAWSTPQVMAQTRDQLRSAGVSWHEMKPLWDVDVPADWQRLLQLEQRDG
jgi:rSAM/selenodomain-associated transferase 2/rSAM/selenodomain-associated transferase 1